MRRTLLLVVLGFVLAGAAVAVSTRSDAPQPPSPEWAASVLSSCDPSDLPRCTGLAIAAAASSNPALVFPAVSAIAAAAPGAYDCHVALHYVALELVRVHDPQELLGFYEPTCLDGFSHGVVEGFALVADDATFDAKIMTLCDRFTPGSIESDTCFHGLGHAFMIKNPSSLEGAARRCAVLGSPAAALCGQGVFMSYTNEGGPSLGDIDLGITLERLTTEEASGLCSALPVSVAPSCWDMAWLLFDPASTSVIDSMRTLCAAAGEFAAMCNQGLGLAIFFRDGSTPPDDPAAFRSYVLERMSRCPASAALPACTNGVAYAGTLWWGSFQDSLTGYQSVCTSLPDPTPELLVACREGESRIAAESGRALSSG